MDRIRIAIIGVGGFAAAHHRAINALESAGVCRLVCSCDPDAAALHSARSEWHWDERGVTSYAGYREMIEAHAHELDVVTVPTPIPLHAEMHRACVEAGIACYLEKPPTLDPAELERMIQVDGNAAHATQVGFNFIVEGARRSLKSRILAGEFGQLRRVSFVGVWPRPASYFTRNAWAGRMFWKDGHLVLDSCVANAMAHYVHNLLFWAGGDGLNSFAPIGQVAAELYRAHDIETFDTCFVRAIVDGGVELRIAATHACAGKSENGEEIVCDDATIRYVTYGTYEITDRDGVVIERGETDRGNLTEANFRAYFDYVRGETARPLTTLADSRPFVHLNDLVYIAAGSIPSLGDPFVRRSETETDVFLEPEGVRDACETFATSGQFPSEQGVPWARAGSEIALPTDLPRLREIASELFRTRLHRVESS